MSSSSPEIVYIDSCVIIAFLKKEKDRYRDCERLFRDAETGRVRMYTSFVAQAETVRGNTYVPTEEQEQRILDLFESPWFHFVQTHRRNMKCARQLIRDHNLKPLDAIHLASAIDIGARFLYTYDGKDLGRLNGVIPNLVICEPPEVIELPLAYPD